MHIAPNHDMDYRERDHGRLKGGCQSRRVVADVGRELPIEPGPKCCKEPHECSGNRLEGWGETSVAIDDLLARLLPGRGLLRLLGLIENLHLELFVLQHAEF